MKTLLWLDDYRDPFDKEIDWLVFSPIGKEDIYIIWVKSYDEFVEHITKYGVPDAVCFDHDLGEGKSGLECAKFLVNYCLDNQVNVPPCNYQSANPVGRDLMKSLINNATKYINCNEKKLR